MTAYGRNRGKDRNMPTSQSGRAALKKARRVETKRRRRLGEKRIHCEWAEKAVLEGKVGPKGRPWRKVERFRLSKTRRKVPRPVTAYESRKHKRDQLRGVV